MNKIEKLGLCLMILGAPGMWATAIIIVHVQAVIVTILGWTIFYWATK
jgi:hypothetical protein